MVACRMCGRTLTTKASRRLGIGPECQAKVKAAEIRNAPDGVYSGGDIVCRRDIFGTHVNVPYKKAEHKRTQEITWGSDSTGDLALNILMLFIPYRKAVQRHRYFKFKFLDALPYEGGVIKEKAIQEFLRETGVKL